MSQFAWIPDFTLVMSSEWKTLESEAETGVKQYRQVWPSNIKSWKLIFEKRTLTEAQAVLAFFDSMKGKATTFTWTCPLDSVEYTVRFKNDRLSIDYIKYQQVDFEIGFEEDIS